MRMKYGDVIFGYKDSYSAEPVLNNIIVSWLENYRDTILSKGASKIGCPCTILSEYIEESPDGHYSGEDIFKGFDKWVEIINEMIYAFKNKEPTLEDFNVKSEEITNSTIVSTQENNYNLYMDALKQHKERVQAGRLLFVKFYDNLWW